MDLTPQKTTYVVDDNSWLDSEHGTDCGHPVTLNLSTFDATQYANGFIPSGTAVAKITATGLFGPYDDSKSNGQETLVGHIYGGVKVNSGSTKAGATLLKHCFVKENKLPFQSGQTGRGYVDAAGKVDVKGAIFYRTA